VPKHRLENYLKPYRRRAGLTQKEVASLLGWKSETQLGRLEKWQRCPTLRNALGLVAALNVPMTGLFAGMYDRIAVQVGKRRAQLLRQLQKATVPAAQARLHERKLEWLTKVEQNSNSRQ